MDNIIQSLKTTVTVYITDDVVVFSRPKNASRVTSSYLTFGSNGIECEVSFDYTDGYKPHLIVGNEIVRVGSKPGGDIRNTTYNDNALKKFVYNEIYNILKGESDKDCILVYREVYDRFISGMYQEYVVAIQNKNFFYHMTINLSAEDKEKLKRFAYTLSFVLGRTEDEVNKADRFVMENIDLVEDTIKYWLNFNKYNYGYNYPHTNNYLGLYNEFLTDYNIDFKRLKLVDVTNNQIEKVLRPYCKNLEHENVLAFLYNEDGSINKHIFSSKPIKNLIADILKKDEDNTTIKYYLSEEFKNYFKLSKHSANKTNLNNTKSKDKK